MLLKIITSRKKHNEYPGFTVLELLIMLAAIAIVILIAVPGSSMVLERHRLKATYNSLVNGLELAKSEANLRNSTVVMCPSSNGQTCRSDGNWNLGWIVFSDGNGDGAVQDIEFIESFEAPSQQIRITAKGAVQASASFTMTGLVGKNDTEKGLFKICYVNSENPPRLVNVTSDGWVQLIRDGNETCQTG